MLRAMLIMIARHLAMSGRRYDVKDPLGSIRAVVNPDTPGTGIEPLCRSLRRSSKGATTPAFSSAFSSVHLGGSMWPHDAEPVRHGGTPVIGLSAPIEPAPSRPERPYESG